jgi:hypothetical protein
MTEPSTKFGGVKGQDRKIIEGGVYDATLTSFSDVQTGLNGEYVFWNFTPDAHPDVEVSLITSITGGWRAKGMEIARRLTGKSNATDQKWGRDLKQKRPVIDWGPELVGSRAQIVVEKVYDEDAETYRNRVVNVVAPGSFKTVARSANGSADSSAAGVDESEFDDIPF